MPAPEAEPRAIVPGGTTAERLASGLALQQGVQVLRLVGGFGVLTLLARRLPLAEFGVYTLLISLGTYVVFVKQSVMNAAVLGIAETLDSTRLRVVLSTGFSLYIGLGLLAGAVLLVIGLTALPLLNVPARLESEARTGVIALAVVTAVGWPAQIFDDALRGMQRFAAVSAMEGIAMVVWIVSAVVLVLVDAPVWLLAAVNGAVPLLQGLACAAAFVALKIPARIAPRAVERDEMRRFGGVMSRLLLGGVADVATYSLDRGVLSAFRSPAAVGLYEGPLQAQSIIRFLNGVLTAPIVPIAARLRAEGDVERLRELFVRGLRYSLAATAPLTIVLVCLPVPVLTAWLGPKYATMGAETAVFCSYWLIGSLNGVVGTTLLASGRVGLITLNAWIIAAVNMAVTIPVTAAAGIWGPITGAVSGFAVGLAWLLPVALRTVGVRMQTVIVRVLIPAYSVGVGLAACLLILSASVTLHGPLVVMAVVAAAAASYWTAYALIWLDADERRLARRTLLRR